MDPPTSSQPSAEPLSVQRAKIADQGLAALSSLLKTLDGNPQANALATPTAEDRHELHLVRARLGVASSLFVALRSKHPPTASHSLRVALAVSSWALAIEAPEDLCNVVEIAALLHDIGKIGVPDHVLMKPGRLSGEELLLMERHRQLGSEIISSCCTSPAILDTVLYAPAWFDGRRHGFDRSGQDLPIGSRMIAIVDAFDAMTTDHVYRRAMSRERALAELFETSGTQFDPDLVKQF